ncbi:MAG: CoB--CoM heterodisulfide reductase iron-sulfur subunit A family protein [Chlorobi bacterium]|nr:CoB--CoM heterodisulfide reductase iron-sulfur subunit A family protein [Chlorobiota bacterium]
MVGIKKPILVIGGGISGITAAIEIAEVGKNVILIEKEPFLGGNVIKMNNYFPKLCPPACGLEINFKRIRQNPRIKIFTSSEVSQIKGEKGNFTVQIKSKPQFVKDTCTACGKCVAVCPEERPNKFNYYFDRTKAIYLPHEMAFPYKYTIDEEYCKKEACNKCAEVCEYDAIDFSAKEKTENIEVYSIVAATGWKNYDASRIENLHYSNFKNVVSNVEFERLIASNGLGNSKLVRPSDKKEPKEIVFVQCAGSRDKKNLSYCSAVCCSASLKHALSVQEKYPESKIKIFYIDLRVAGRNEDFLNRVEANKNIELIKGKVAKIEEIKETENLLVEAENILLGKKQKYEADLVVLATGIVPNDPGFTIQKNSFGFLRTEKNEGIHPIACSKKPMDVSTSVKDATAAALKAIQ